MKQIRKTKIQRPHFIFALEKEVIFAINTSNKFIDVLGPRNYVKSILLLCSFNKFFLIKIYNFFLLDYTNLSLKNSQNIEVYKMPVRNLKENFRLPDILKTKYHEQLKLKYINFQKFEKYLKNFGNLQILNFLILL